MTRLQHTPANMISITIGSATIASTRVELRNFTTVLQTMWFDVRACMLTIRDTGDRILKFWSDMCVPEQCAKVTHWNHWYHDNILQKFGAEHEELPSVDGDQIVMVLAALELLQVPAVVSNQMREPGRAWATLPESYCADVASFQSAMLELKGWLKMDLVHKDLPAEHVAHVKNWLKVNGKDLLDKSWIVF